MAARWKVNEEQRQLLVAELESRRDRDPLGPGMPTFRADLGYEYVTTLLQSAIAVSEEIPRFDARLILGDGLFDAAATGPLTPGPLVGAVGRREHSFLRRRPMDLVLVSSLSARHRPELSRKRVAGCHIGFDRGLRRDRFSEEHRRARSVARDSVFGEYPDPMSVSGHYSSVKVFVRGRSFHEAALKGIAALDLLRAIWNLYLNRTRAWPADNPRRRPVNRVLLGPIHSLHHRDGTLATEDVVFYEPDYAGPVPNQDLRPVWNDLALFESSVRRALRRNPYGEEMEEALRRYCRALDTRNWGSGFLELWSLLETLTGTGKDDTHADTVARTAFNYSGSERPLHELVLDDLRDHRNRSVHAGQQSDQEEVYLYELKTYVENLLQRQLANPYRFHTIRDSARFMSQPAEPASLEQRQRSKERELADLREELRLTRLARKFHGRP